MKTHVLWILIAAALATAGCKSLEPFFARPDISFETLAFKNMSLSQGTLVFTFRVHNPNPMGISVNTAAYDLHIDGRPMARGTFDQGVRLPPAGTRSVDLPVTVSFIDLLENAAALSGRDSVPYALSGSFAVLGVDVPFQTEGTLPVPKMPRFSLEAVEVGVIGFSGAELNFVIALANPNPFGIRPDGLDYTIELGGIRFLSGRTENLSAISANGTARIALPANIDFSGLGRTAMHLLGNPSAMYRLSGSLRVDRPEAGQLALPFAATGRVPLIR